MFFLFCFFLFPCFSDPCSSLALWKGVIVGACGSGQIKVYNLATGKLGACANAHARWINAIDVAKDSGLVSSFYRIIIRSGKLMLVNWSLDQVLLAKTNFHSKRK